MIFSEMRLRGERAPNLTAARARGLEDLQGATLGMSGSLNRLGWSASAPRQDQQVTTPQHH